MNFNARNACHICALVVTGSLSMNIDAMPYKILNANRGKPGARRPSVGDVHGEEQNPAHETSPLSAASMNSRGTPLKLASARLQTANEIVSGKRDWSGLTIASSDVPLLPDHEWVAQEGTANWLWLRADPAQPMMQQWLTLAYLGVVQTSQGNSVLNPGDVFVTLPQELDILASPSSARRKERGHINLLLRRGNGVKRIRPRVDSVMHELGQFVANLSGAVPERISEVPLRWEGHMDHETDSRPTLAELRRLIGTP